MLRHVIGHILARWLVARGDSHYARPEATAWCERQRVGYIFGLSGHPVLLRQVGGPLAEDAALGRLAGEAVTRTKMPCRAPSLIRPASPISPVVSHCCHD